MRTTNVINPSLPVMWHGADYNPDQWLKYPGIFEEDIRLMKLAGCNVVSLGIFSWTMLEPEEGVYHFEWMDHVIDKLYENGIYTILATPSGAKPAWLAAIYPVVLRVDGVRRRHLYGGRLNHCCSSLIYHDLLIHLNTRLAKRYADHHAIIMSHVSMEYGGHSHFPVCQALFINLLH